MYVTITGARNNAGDYLIKTRALQHLENLRPDRKLVNLNSWEKLEEGHLETINASRALVLCGGPAVRRTMVPTYDLPLEKLKRIRVPIVTMGLGWKHSYGTWSAIRATVPTDDTNHLLARIKADGLSNSVRDLEAKEFMAKHGADNVKVTGCPALFADIRSDTPAAQSDSSQVVFSVGVLGRAAGSGFDGQAKEVITTLCDMFGRSSIVVAFHHSLDDRTYASVYGGSKVAPDAAFRDWVSAQGLETRDISGAVEEMLHLYADCRLHVGYRVHAHILCTSFRRPSILIAEDARGFGVGRLLGGWVVPAFEAELSTKASSRSPPNRRGLASLFGLARHDPTPMATKAVLSYQPSSGVLPLLREAFESVLADELARFEGTWSRASELRRRMVKFLEALP